MTPYNPPPHTHIEYAEGTDGDRYIALSAMDEDSVTNSSLNITSNIKRVVMPKHYLVNISRGSAVTR